MTDYEILGIRENASFEEVRMAYKNLYQRYQLEHANRKIQLIVSAYHRISEKMKEECLRNMRKETLREKLKQNKLLLDIQKYLKMLEENKEKYDLDSNCDIFDSIKEIMMKENTSDSYALLLYNYLQFLSIFEKFWKKIYNEFCIKENQAIQEGDYRNNKSYFVFDYSSFFRKSNFLGDHLFQYKEMFDYLSYVVPSESVLMIFDEHMKIFSKLHFLDFHIETFDKDQSYYFDIQSRTNVVYDQFIEIFDEDQRRGIRKKPFINNEELQEYVRLNLEKYNPQLFKSRKKLEKS